MLPPVGIPGLKTGYVTGSVENCITEVIKKHVIGVIFY
jgi:hypothetical protein